MSSFLVLEEAWVRHVESDLDQISNICLWSPEFVVKVQVDESDVQPSPAKLWSTLLDLMDSGCAASSLIVMLVTLWGRGGSAMTFFALILLDHLLCVLFLQKMIVY